MAASLTEQHDSRIGNFSYKSTNIDRHQCTRTVPLEVLCLGRERTGTASLREALYQLGYAHVYHHASVLHENSRDSEMWRDALSAKFEKKVAFERKDWDQLLGHCMVSGEENRCVAYSSCLFLCLSWAVSDVPVCLFGPELMAAYPNARIILSVRDSSASWKRSILGTMWRAYELRGSLMEPTSNVFPEIYRFLLPRSPTEPMDRLYWKHIGYNHGPDNLDKLYEEHNAMILQTAKEMGREVLLFNIKQGWDPLCKFLGKEAPNTPYPNMNNQIMFTSDLDFFKKIMVGVAIANARKYVGIVAGVGYLARWAMLR